MKVSLFNIAQAMHLLSDAIATILSELPIEHQTKGSVADKLMQVKTIATEVSTVAQIVEAVSASTSAPAPASAQAPLNPVV